VRKRRFVVSITLKTHKLLWGACGNVCTKCKKKVVEDATMTDDASIVGEEAHIVSKEPNGPRYSDPLPMEKRDLFENLMILCNGCHKIVDDQENTYPAAALRKMKADHEQAVLETFGQGDPVKRRDDLIYAGYVDDWVQRAEVDKWEDWSYGMMSHSRPQMKKERFDRLDELKKWVLSRAWPGRYPSLEKAFHNFRRVLEDMLNTFIMGADLVGKDTILMTRNYSPKEWLEEEESEAGLKRHERHIYLVMDLMAELTRAGNYILERVRETISPTFRLKEGWLLATAGPFQNGADRIMQLRYRGDERVEVPYPGVAKFAAARGKRDYCFGQPDELVEGG
jgi:hypothetical protein